MNTKKFEKTREYTDIVFGMMIVALLISVVAYGLDTFEMIEKETYEYFMTFSNFYLLVCVFAASGIMLYDESYLLGLGFLIFAFYMLFMFIRTLGG